MVELSRGEEILPKQWLKRNKECVPDVRLATVKINNEEKSRERVASAAIKVIMREACRSTPDVYTSAARVGG